MSNKEKVVAIDGPSGSGKSTVAKMVAKALGVLYVDTGAMFRALAYYFKNTKGLDLDTVSDESLKEALKKLQFEYGINHQILVRLDGEDLTQKIREHSVSALASKISQKKVIREYLLDFQRKLAGEKFCCMEGRDIGTVVFPHAFCKIYLTASLEERARRRLSELKAKGISNNLTFDQLVLDVKQRDEQDMNRKEAPLKKAEDANLVDTTGLSIEQVVDKIVLLAREKALSLKQVF